MLTEKLPSFTKMHALGNDFVIINSLHKNIQLSPLRIEQLANRYVGIGFDQLLLIESSKKGDFFCRIINADGSEAEQCGNGLRCVARFLFEEKLIPKKKFNLETIAGVFDVEILHREMVSVNLGQAIFDQHLNLRVSSDELIHLTSINIGNPHVIMHVDSAHDAPVKMLGAKISNHPIFPNGVNVGFMEIVSDSHIRLRTYERGVGETLACGSNACAAVCAGILNQLLKNDVRVEFRFGSLWIQQNDKGEIIMVGPTTRVFDGVLCE